MSCNNKCSHLIRDCLDWTTFHAIYASHLVNTCPLSCEAMVFTWKPQTFTDCFRITQSDCCSFETVRLTVSEYSAPASEVLVFQLRNGGAVQQIQKTTNLLFYLKSDDYCNIFLYYFFINVDWCFVFSSFSLALVYGCGWWLGLTEHNCCTPYPVYATHTNSWCFLYLIVLPSITAFQIMSSMVHYFLFSTVATLCEFLPSLGRMMAVYQIIKVVCLTLVWGLHLCHSPNVCGIISFI